MNLQNILKEISLKLKTKNNIVETISPQNFKNEVLKIASSNVLSKNGIGTQTGFSIIKKLTIQGGEDKVIKPNAFEHLYLTEVIIADDIEEIGNRAFYDTNLSNISIPSKVISIGIESFMYNSMLINLNIPEDSQLETIGERCFTDCKSLKKIFIPKKVNYIPGSSFNGTYSVEEIIVDENNENYNSRNGCNAIIKTDTNTLILGCKNTEIPVNVTTIGPSAFSGQSNLEWVDLTNITSIGSNGFINCKKLNGIELNDSITTLAPYLFSGCTSLSSINIPEEAKSVDSYALNGCIKLVELVFPSKLNYIGAFAFQNCSSIIKFDFTKLSSVPILSNVNAFSGVSPNMKIIVSDDSYDSWIVATNWLEFGPNGTNSGRMNKIIKESEYNSQYGN